jgi:OPA family sugar phosphate sensor protein UhpC-like MFS transporter
MPNFIASLFKTGPDRSPSTSDAAAIDRLYGRRRLALFISVTLGYGLFYTCRINFSVAKKSMLDAGIMSATQMGLAGSALLMVYSVGKLVNGFLADRCKMQYRGPYRGAQEAKTPQQ